MSKLELAKRDHWHVLKRHILYLLEQPSQLGGIIGTQPLVDQVVDVFILVAADPAANIVIDAGVLQRKYVSSRAECTPAAVFNRLHFVATLQQRAEIH